MYDEHFFILLSFIFFIGLAFKPCKQALISIMDNYSHGVLKSATEAERIRKEAEVELSKIKKKAAAINVEVERMLAEAKEESQVIMEEARIEAEHMLAKRTKLAFQRIAQQEETIHRTVRDELVAHVLRSVEAALAGNLDAKAKQELTAASLKSAKKLIH